MTHSLILLLFRLPQGHNGPPALRDGILLRCAPDGLPISFQQAESRDAVSAYAHHASRLPDPFSPMSRLRRRRHLIVWCATDRAGGGLEPMPTPVSILGPPGEGLTMPPLGKGCQEPSTILLIVRAGLHTPGEITSIRKLAVSTEESLPRSLGVRPYIHACPRHTMRLQVRL